MGNQKQLTVEEETIYWSIEKGKEKNQ